MKKRWIILVLLMSIITAQSVWAIPGFARRYKISCSTCHVVFPRLKPYGDDFAGAGFILKEEEKARDYVTAGDDLLWLNRDFPIGARFDAYGVAEPDATVKNDFQTPWGLKLLSGGALYKNIGYYFYFYMSERGEVAGIEDAYLHFDNLFGKELDLMVGQFQVCDPLMKRELRLTFEDYEIYKTRVGNSGTNLAYDRGAIVAFTCDKTGTDLVFMAVNGNGKAEADQATKKFDSDAGKNIALRVAQPLGEHLSLGGFYYTGKEEIAGGVENEIAYYGPDLVFEYGPVAFTGQYLVRTDSDPYFNSGPKMETKGIVAELFFAPKLDRSRFYWTALYNRIESDCLNIEYETATLSCSYLLARNLRLMAEYTRDLLYDANRFVVGTTAGF